MVTEDAVAPSFMPMAVDVDELQVRRPRRAEVGVPITHHHPPLRPGDAEGVHRTQDGGGVRFPPHRVRAADERIERPLQIQRRLHRCGQLWW